MISKSKTSNLRCAVLLALGFAAIPAHAVFNVQCPGDTNGTASWTTPEVQPANTKCMHLTGGDGFARMADGTTMYMFGFNDVTGQPGSAANLGITLASWPAPTIELDEGDEFFLTLSNVGMALRPDLSDPHSVHFHGFPNASAFFDGEPESTFGVNMGSSVTYYYNIKEPGTYLYHCHVEAAEHMQMGMLGNLYVRPLQDRLGIHPVGTTPDDATKATRFGGDGPTGYVFNDGDGSTAYDVSFPLQFSGFDAEFHEASYKVQLAPGNNLFAGMRDEYPMINGRGYPDSVAPMNDHGNGSMVPSVDGLPAEGPAPDLITFQSQPMGSQVRAVQGKKLLLRLSNVSIAGFYTITATGLPMQVVGQGAKILRGNGDVHGQSLYYNTGSVTLGGGEANDVLIDTTHVAPGTYFLYTTNLEHLNNGNEDNGGMMTEIVIEPPV